MNEEQRARMEYLREDLQVWEERRRRARWSLAADKLYNCTAMDQALGQMVAELKELEFSQPRLPNKRRIGNAASSQDKAK